jgi:hypothetical protein
MADRLNKFIRAFRRDYLPHVEHEGSNYTLARQWKLTVPLLLGICLAVAGACAGFGLGMEALGILWFCAQAAPAMIGIDMYQARKKMKKRTSGRLEGPDDEDVMLSGPGRNICIVENTQKLVERWTAAQKNAPQLSPGLMAQLEPYINDSAEAAETVAATRRAVAQDDISFLRQSFDESGGAGRQVVASVLTAQGVQKKKASLYQAAVTAAAEQMHTGLEKSLSIRPLRLKRDIR